MVSVFPFCIHMYAYLCGVSKMFTEEADLKSDTLTVTLTCTSLVKSHGPAVTVTSLSVHTTVTEQQETTSHPHANSIDREFTTAK